MAKVTVTDNSRFIDDDGDSVEIRHAMLEVLLPFVKLSEECDTPWWNVPYMGNYHFGYCIGETMAHTLMRYYKRHHDADDLACQLTNIVTSMMVHFVKLDGINMENKPCLEYSPEYSPEYESFRGQYVGFFNTIGQFLSRAR